jgi:putative NADPH-quinone reductase
LLILELFLLLLNQLVVGRDLIAFTTDAPEGQHAERQRDHATSCAIHHGHKHYPGAPIVSHRHPILANVDAVSMPNREQQVTA